MKRVMLIILYMLFVSLLASTLHNWSSFRSVLHSNPLIDSILCLSALGLLHFYIQRLRLVVAAHKLAGENPIVLKELLDIAKNKNI